MATYDDTNSGIIGANSFKKNDRQPDLSGRINIEGVWYWLSGWHNSKNGRSYTTLAATIMTQDQVDAILEKRAAKHPPQQAAQQQQPRQQPQSQTPPAGRSAEQAPPLGEPSAPSQNQEPPMDFDDDIPF